MTPLRRLRRRRAPPLRDRHVLWMPQAKLAYFRVPKAASSSVRYLLADTFGLRGTDGFKHSKDISWHQADPSRARSMTPASYEHSRQTRGGWSFSVVRHPVLRLYSCWNNKVVENENLSARFLAMGVHKGMDFAAFVDVVAATPDDDCDVHVQSQIRFVTHEGRVLPDFVGRVERLRADWQHIRYQIWLHTGQELKSLPEKNVRQSAPPKPEEIAAPEVIAKIEARYAEDMRLFYPPHLSRNLT